MIYLGKYKGEPVAVKQLNLGNTAKKAEALEELQREVRIMSTLSHPNIVNLKVRILSCCLIRLFIACFVYADVVVCRVTAWSPTAS